MQTPRVIGLEHLQYNQALHNFLSCSLPDQAKEEVPLLWLCSISDITADAHALQLAISALSYGWVGHVEESAQLVNKARSIYVCALQRLHRMLSENPSPHSDTTLATVQCLALYEVSNLKVNLIDRIRSLKRYRFRFLKLEPSLNLAGLLICLVLKPSLGPEVLRDMLLESAIKCSCTLERFV